MYMHTIITISLNRVLYTLKHRCKNENNYTCGYHHPALQHYLPLNITAAMRLHRVFAKVTRLGKQIDINSDMGSVSRCKVDFDFQL